jgi:DNA polymerase I-like protein with 3'-5' exonuclease and polymerase domains
MLEGSLSGIKILFVSDFLRPDENALGVVLNDQRKSLIVNALNRAGVPESDYAFTVMYPFMPPGLNLSNVNEDQRVLARIACKKIINDSGANVIVPLGEHALNFITGLENINKQHCSILKVKAEFGDRKAIPLLHPEYVQRDYASQAYISFGCQRIKAESHSKNLELPDRKFLLSLDLSFEQIVDYLENKVLKAPELSIDVETGRGLVNTHGFAISPKEAIAIDVLPSSYTPAQYHKLWSLIAKVLESDIPKLAQNALYESQWASLYGIRLQNVSFETMWAMKLLHPTLDKGLDNVGRIYTRQPYWKDDHSDWNNVRNWRDHLSYNCKDTCGTFEAKINMQADLEQRGLMPMFQNYMKLFQKAQKMTNEGLKISSELLEAARKDTERDIEQIQARFDEQTQKRLDRKVNINSPKQIKEMLKEIGIKIPTKAGSETVNKEALAKLRKSNPKEELLKDLVKLSKLNSELDSYFNFNFDQDGRVRFSLDAVYNEFGEWGSSKNPFGSGFDLEMLPRKTKSCIVADEGCEFVEIRLNNFEQEYLALDSGDSRMIRLISAGDSISAHLAASLFNKAVGIINPRSAEFRIASMVLSEAAYGVSARALATKLMAFHDKYVSEVEAKRFIGIVFELFPGLRKRQERIQYSIRTTRRLKNLLGREIVFYDRINDDLFKKAYQWGFRSLQADVLNNLITSADLPVVALNSRSVLVQAGSLEEAYEIISKCSSWQLIVKTQFGACYPVPRFRMGTVWGGLKDV